MAVVLEGGTGTPAPSGSPAPGAGLGWPPGPPPGPPPGSFGPLPRGHPAAELLQRMGDGNTVFLIHGTGWPPLTPITVTLPGRGVAQGRLVADQAGTFNYAIDQGHVFYPGQIPPGYHDVLISGAGHRITLGFFVHPPGPPGGPGSPGPSSG